MLLVTQHKGGRKDSVLIIIIIIYTQGPPEFGGTSSCCRTDKHAVLTFATRGDVVAYVVEIIGASVDESVYIRVYESKQDVSASKAIRIMINTHEISRRIVAKRFHMLTTTAHPPCCSIYGPSMSRLGQAPGGSKTHTHTHKSWSRRRRVEFMSAPLKLVYMLN